MSLQEAITLVSLSYLGPKPRPRPTKTYNYLLIHYFSLYQRSGYSKWLSAAFGQTCFRWVDLGPPFFQWFNFLTPLLFLRLLGWSHYCPFRFKSAVIAFIVGRVLSRFLTFCFLMFFTLSCSLCHSVPVFIARQLLCQRFIVLFVFHDVRTFSYCFAPHGLSWRLLRFIALLSVFRVFS